MVWENGYTYIGHCCYEFYEKRYEIFKKAKEWGANGVLIDIEGVTCYSLGIEEEEKAYHGEFQVELDLYVKDSEKLLSIKPKPQTIQKRTSAQRPIPNETLKEFFPEYYKVPKVAPGPAEDMSRLPIVKETSTEIGFVKGEKVSYEEALKEAVKLLKEAERPTLIVGPLVLWTWNEEAKRKGELIRELKNKLPHLSILHGKHDLTLHRYKDSNPLHPLRTPRRGRLPRGSERGKAEKNNCSLRNRQEEIRKYDVS